MNKQANMKTVVLFQAMCPQQLAALIRADWRRIEPGRGGEHFLLLKLNQRYAEMIVRQWEVPMHGAGYVVRMILPARAMAGYDLETVAYDEHLEYRIPVCDLAKLNRHLLGELHIVSAFTGSESYSVSAGSKPLASLIG